MKLRLLVSFVFVAIAVSPVTITYAQTKADMERVQKEFANPSQRRPLSKEEIRTAFGESKPNPNVETMSRGTFLTGWTLDVIIKFVLLATAVFGGRYLWRWYFDRADDAVDDRIEAMLGGGQGRMHPESPIAKATSTTAVRPRGAGSFGKRF